MSGFLGQVCRNLCGKYQSYWQHMENLRNEKWECFICFNSFGPQSLAMHVFGRSAVCDRDEQEIKLRGGRPEPERTQGSFCSLPLPLCCSTSTCASKAFINSIMVPFKLYIVCLKYRINEGRMLSSTFNKSKVRLMQHWSHRTCSLEKEGPPDGLSDDKHHEEGYQQGDSKSYQGAKH